MFEEVMTYLHDLHIVSIIIRFVLAIICGGIIGIERGKKRQAAGFRTHILVCIGATIAMMTGQFISETLAYNSDPARMGAQVISGIGFLGVGTIIVTQSNKVRGLTTAAGLWASACIGLALGIGFYEAAIIGTLFVVVTMVTLQKLDEIFYARSPVGEFFLELDGIRNVRALLKLLKEHDLKVSSLEMRKSQYGDEHSVGVMLSVKKLHHKDGANVFDIISQTEGLIFIEEIF